MSDLRTPTAISGGCLCGAVRYVATAEPIVTRTCWCRLCQKIGGGSATVNAGFPRAAVTISGPLADHASVAESGSHMHRRFCPTCGIHLFSEAEERPQLIFVRVGTFDDPGIAPPAMTIWTSQAPGWACIDPDIPRFDAQPPPPGMPTSGP
jgi:hypothetical protein